MSKNQCLIHSHQSRNDFIRSQPQNRLSRHFQEFPERLARLVPSRITAFFFRLPTFPTPTMLDQPDPCDRHSLVCLCEQPPLLIFGDTIRSPPFTLDAVGWSAPLVAGMLNQHSPCHRHSLVCLCEQAPPQDFTTRPSRFSLDDSHPCRSVDRSITSEVNATPNQPDRCDDYRHRLVCLWEQAPSQDMMIQAQPPVTRLRSVKADAYRKY